MSPSNPAQFTQMPGHSLVVFERALVAAVGRSTIRTGREPLVLQLVSRNCWEWGRRVPAMFGKAMSLGIHSKYLSARMIPAPTSSVRP